MVGVLSDIRTSCDVFRNLRRVRSEGGTAQIKKIWQFPVVNIGYWGFTLEACIFQEDYRFAIMHAFNNFDEETQKACTFVPAVGEWGNRVRLWQEALRPVLPPKDYHNAIQTLIWYGIHCVRMRKGTAK